MSIQHEFFIFERDIPAADRWPNDVYLEGLAKCVRDIEHYGTGTGDMIQRCVDDLPEPDFQLTDGFVTMIYRPAALNSAAGSIPHLRKSASSAVQ